MNYSGHKGWVTSTAISKCNQFVITGSSDMTAKLFELHSGKLLKTFKGHNSSIGSVAF